MLKLTKEHKPFKFLKKKHDQHTHWIFFELFSDDILFGQMINVPSRQSLRSSEFRRELRE